MSGKRLFAIVVIFVLASVAWVVLAGSVQVRTTSTDDRLGDAVGGLWGSPQTQEAPEFRSSQLGVNNRMEIAGSDISAKFKLNQRRKGLLWYATYVVDFKAAYKLKNPAGRPADTTMTFTFPDAAGTYDGFAVKVRGVEIPVQYSDGKANASFVMAPGETVTVATGYKTNGMERWVYVPSPGGAGVVKDFKLAMATDFVKIDYPADGVSPTASTRTDDGWNLLWSYASVVSGRPIGIVMPVPPNPGPLVARITAFAPVSLLFFFAALILLTATSGIKLHPVHYGFLAAAFFAFDLLLAYLADQIDINLAFLIAAATSIVLVVGYLLVVVGKNRALVEIAISQFVFLVLFSYSFFFTGFTGLAITIGAVLTLAYFMAKTAKVDWEEVFPKKEPKPTPPSWSPQPPQYASAPVQPLSVPPRCPLRALCLLHPHLRTHERVRAHDRALDRAEKPRLCLEHHPRVGDLRVDRVGREQAERLRRAGNRIAGSSRCGRARRRARCRAPLRARYPPSTAPARRPCAGGRRHRQGGEAGGGDVARTQYVRPRG